MTMRNLTRSILTCLVSTILLLAVLFAPTSVQALTKNYLPTAIDTIFYTSLTLGIIFAAIIIIAYREYKWLSYALFIAILTTSLAAMDGTLAYFIGSSDFVIWVIPFLIHASACSYGYGLISYHLDPAHPLSKYKPLFITLAIISALFPLTSFFWLKQISLATMWIPINVLFFGMIIMQLLPPFTWRASTQFETTLTKLFAVIMVTITSGLYLAYFFPLDAFSLELKTINRIALLLFALGSLGIVILRLFIHSKEKEQAEYDALNAAKKQAETELNLLQLERNYENAVAIASHHQTQLSTVSHDLKQPIAVLQLILSKLSESGQNVDTHKLSNAINYMDDLVQHLLSTETDVADPNHLQANEDNTESISPKENIATALLAKTIAQMFKEEAQEKGSQLTVHYQEATLFVEPLPIMRLMNNLVANAINHAGATRILITFRKRQSHILFQVIDNGSGISEDQLATLMQVGQKSEHSSGQGLGLNIIQSLSQQHGITFNIKSNEGKGTQCSLLIPLE